MSEAICFHTCSFQANQHGFIPIILPVDAEEVMVACFESDWYVSHTQYPTSLDESWIVKAGIGWTFILARRKTLAGTIVGYARSVDSDITLRCYLSLPAPGVL